MKKLVFFFFIIIFSCFNFSQEMKFGLRISEENFETFYPLLENFKQDKDSPLYLSLFLKENIKEIDLAYITNFIEKANSSNFQVNVILTDPQLNDEEKINFFSTLSHSLKNKVYSFELILNKSFFEREDLEKAIYDLKRMTLALRGESLTKIYIGSIESDILDKLEPYYTSEIIAYVDGYSTFEVTSYNTPTSEVTNFIQKYHLGSPIRTHLKKTKSHLQAQTNIMVALSKGIEEVDIEIENPNEGLNALTLLRKNIPKNMVAGYDVTGVEIKQQEIRRNDIAIFPFLDPELMLQAFYLAPTGTKSEKGTLSLFLATADIKNPYALEMPNCTRSDLSYIANEKKGISEIKFNYTGKPILIIVERLKTGTVLKDEGITVIGTYKIPVEFIIARHQAVENNQNLFLKNYTAEAVVNYHFKIPGSSGSLDVTFINQFFYDRKGGARWVQKELLINGVKWKGKTIPELPIIEPEKINTLPLVLTMSRAYSYRLIKEEVLKDKNCYVIEFISLKDYSQNVTGKVWIDKETYQKIQIQIIQKNMTPPQVSNEEFDHYEEMNIDGKTFNILKKIKAQQIFTVIGQTITAEKEVYFNNITINDEEYEKKLEEAYKSDYPILQDTEKGYRYLSKNKEGNREIRWEEKSGKWSAVAGAYYDESLDYPLPFLGANYFDYNYKKKDVQLNLFLAGPIDSISFSKPNLFKNFDLSINGIFFLFYFKDRFFENGEEIEEKELKTMKERIYFTLSNKISSFSKLNLDLKGTYVNFKKSKNSSYLFKIPSNHLDFSYGLSFDYSRKGWLFNCQWEGHKRSEWKEWGFLCDKKQIDKKKDYILYGASIGKTFYFKNFQKAGFSLSYLDGKDLDRFSKYEFTYMGEKSLSGFTGSGIKFNKGFILKNLYSIDIVKLIRFSISLDYAKVKETQRLNYWQDHLGLGITGTISGPLNTICSLDIGYALKSDIPKVKGSFTIALILFKLWGR